LDNSQNPDPIRQFTLWFEEAKAAGAPLPEAFCLSTVSPTGLPEGRMLLLKGVEEAGFVFYTNLNSPKAVSMGKKPKAALTFYWEKLRKQVRVVGSVVPVSESEADAYFHSRPRDSQIGAWASFQSEPLESRQTLEKRFEDFSKRYENREIPRPEHWSGYRLKPDTVEFWVEQPNRLHDRFLYEEKNGTWKITRLNP